MSSNRNGMALIPLLVLGIALHTLSGCGPKPPLEEIASAEAAIEKAREAEAPKYAAETFRSAEDMLSQARKEVDEKAYGPAKGSAIKSRELALKSIDEAKRAQAAKEAAEKPESEEAGPVIESGRISMSELETEKIGTGTMGKGMRIKSLPPIHFEFDKYALTQEARGTLKKNSEWLKRHNNITILIEGHCDEWGANEYNIALGDQRAQAARDYLVYLGVEADRVKTVSYGEEYPVDPASNKEAWAKNRRAEFVVVGD